MPCRLTPDYGTDAWYDDSAKSFGTVKRSSDFAYVDLEHCIADKGDEGNMICEAVGG